MPNHLLKIAAAFQTKSPATRIEVIEAGHINDTYTVESAAGRYVLQRINHLVFCDPHGLMRNVTQVTNHLRHKLAGSSATDIDRRVLLAIPTISGESLHQTPTGDYWRMYSFVEHTHTVGPRATIDEVYQAAFGFGDFVAQLVDLSATELCETIPQFHHGPSRYTAFAASVAADSASRVATASKEIDLVEQHQALLLQPQQLIESGELPLRVTHNDTKCNNILLDDATNRAICVIDLDTVMPGLALYDFGDMVRTSACGAAEDETDLAQVVVEVDRLTQATRGYLAGIDGVLSTGETASLAMGPSYMTLIMATRFLTDYLQGDPYYKTTHSIHNLDRCRCQLALLAQFELHEDKLANLLGPGME